MIDTNLISDINNLTNKIDKLNSLYNDGNSDADNLLRFLIKKHTLELNDLLVELEYQINLTRDTYHLVKPIVKIRPGKYKSKTGKLFKVSKYDYMETYEDYWNVETDSNSRYIPNVFVYFNSLGAKLIDD